LASSIEGSCRRVGARVCRLAAIGTALLVSLALVSCGGSRGGGSSVAAITGSESATTGALGTGVTSKAHGTGKADSANKLDGASATKGAGGAGTSTSPGAGAQASGGSSSSTGGSATGGSATPSPRGSRSHGDGVHRQGTSTLGGAVHGRPSGGGSTSVSGSSGSGESSGSTSGEQTYEVTSLNMEPSYPPRTTVLYDPTRTTPAVGEVVVFRLPVNAIERGCADNPPPQHACQDAEAELSQTLALGRVVGVAGESLAFDEGNVIRNGQLQSEPSTVACGNGPVCTFTGAITVPEDSYYILYDNRAQLDDSRVWGAVPQNAILGVVTGKG
jgi:signal peptidase I